MPLNSNGNISTCWLLRCACTHRFNKKKPQENKTRSCQKTSILANYHKLIFVFPDKQNSSISSTEALKSKWVSYNSIRLVGQNTIYLKITTRFTFNNIFQRKLCKVHPLKWYAICRPKFWSGLCPSPCFPHSPYIYTHIHSYLQTHTKKSTFTVQIQSSFL